ncbi:MAG: hypothetical protein H0T51_08055 [Pirellulales bacterium]|nr:hypothetical protein [Pirellulales bacterium]
MLPRPHNLRWMLLPLAAVYALAPGCAGLQFPRCPRIDPTGQRCFIFPKDEAVAPVAALPVAALPPMSVNPVAPPVGTDPFFPQVPAVAATVAPGVAAAPMATPASVAYPHLPQDKLSITPGRILAPVGSEVVLKSSICTPEGYTLANQKVEWMLGRNGVGQFVETGGKGVFHPPLIPWNRGEKVDNYLAHGYTADGPLCIDRGTADPTDDVNINRGDAWISVTSPNEGTSHVTAFTPAVESWDLRKAAATIYWVDVQWTFPPSSITATRSGETLTTVVTRQTDGTPIEGWIVRYEVADGGASTGGVSDVRTGADGRASVQVAPTASGAATSQINVQLLRPANFAGGDAPQLVVGTGTTVINWGGSQPYLPPTTSPPMTSQPAPTSPGAPIQQNPITPPPSLPATGQARLELIVQGPPQATVGGTSPLRITIRNVGDSPATNIVLNDKFDPGLVFPPRPRDAEIGKSIDTLAPGQQHEEELTFQVNKEGELCHTLTVNYAQGSPVSKRVCVNAVGAAPQRQGGLKVSISELAAATLGQPARLTFTVENTGQTPLTNIRTEIEFPTGILQPQPDPNSQIISGKILGRIERLEAGTKRQFEIAFDTMYATQATVLFRGRADTDPPTFSIENTADQSFEIQRAGGHPAAGPGPGPAAPAATNPLSVVVRFVNPTVRVGVAATVEVTVTNKGTVNDENVALRVSFPPNVTPDRTRVEGPPNMPAPELQGGMLVFAPLAVVPPNETVRFVIPISANQVGIVPIIAQARSRRVPEPATNSANLEIISNTL